MAELKIATYMTMPPWILARKASRKVWRLGKSAYQRVRDTRQTTYGTLPSGDTALERFIEPLPLDALLPHEATILALSDFYRTHCFDLLGSGWVNVRHGMACQGMEGHSYSPLTLTVDAEGHWLANEIDPANLEESRRCWRLLYRLAPAYVPIDWQRDFKSGFRWTAATWSQDMLYGHQPGADIKVPWELARLQHGVQLAWAYALSRNNRPGFQASERYRLEFQSQILDFIATNPPRFGVNWMSSMEIAIRVTNWVAAYDLFRAYGAEFDSDFIRSLTRSVHQHASHIRRNLEWDPAFRGNHYLANILGLLYAAAYLPTSSETDAWFAFAARELEKETQLQFHPEGTTIENSTGYHRLSSEMCVYGTALAARKGIAFTDAHFQLIAAMAEFTRDITKPDGHVPQIGDNDNGRLFKFFPAFRKDAAGEWKEDHLDHQSSSAETALIELLSGSGRNTRTIQRKKESPAPKSQDWEGLKASLVSRESSLSKRHTYPVTGENFLSGLQIHPYPQFGLYIFRSKRFYLAVRCGAYAQRPAVHAHNDQLSIELQIDGKDIHRDPGTFVYTALPNIRNQYRSVRAHFAPQGDREPGRLDEGLFVIGDPAPGQCLYWGEKGFIGKHQGFGSAVTRLIELSPRGIDLLDVYEEERVARVALEPVLLPFSPGYGVRRP